MRKTNFIEMGLLILLATGSGCDYKMTSDESAGSGAGAPDGGLYIGEVGDSDNTSDTGAQPNTGTGRPFGGDSDHEETDAEDEELPAFPCVLDFEDKTDLVTNDAGVIELTGEIQRTSILFLFDKSGSMHEYWDNEPKWNAASRALVDAVRTSNELLGGNLRVGGILFPMPDQCLVAEMSSGEQMPFAPAEEFLKNWENAMRENQPGGSTPLGEAFRVADKLLAEMCAGGELNHLFKILVLTDGEPTCEEPGEAWSEFPARWLERGFKTYVFGLPGSQGGEQVLNDIADAGGTGEYMAPVKDLPDGGMVEYDTEDLSSGVTAAVI